MLNKKFALLIIGALAISVFAPLSVVYAQETGEDNPTSSEVENEVENKQEEVKKEVNERAKKRSEELKKTAEARRQEIKKNVEAKKVEIKKDVCENRQSRLKSLQPRLNTRALNIKTRLDQRYEKVVEFYQSKNLALTDYETLVQAIEVAKANADTAISTMEGYEFEVDCESETVASDLATYREATSATKESLKEYRAKIVDLINSIKPGLNSTTTTEGGSTNE